MGQLLWLLFPLLRRVCTWHIFTQLHLKWLGEELRGRMSLVAAEGMVGTGEVLNPEEASVLCDSEQSKDKHTVFTFNPWRSDRIVRLLPVS